MAHDLAMKSRVQPKYKTKYRVGNWPAYERGLVQRGDVTLWLSADARDAWRPSPSGQPGGQQRFSDLAISTTLTLRLVFRLPLRQAEGFVRSVLASMDVDLEAPDHTTLSRRSRYLAVGLHRVPVKGPIHLIVDSTGLSIAGEGEWATAKHGGRGQRGWKKLHLGVDGAGVIVAHTLTEATVDDATTGVGLIEALHADLARVTADAAYDTIAFYAAATARERNRRGPSEQGGTGVATETTVERSGSHDPEDEADRAPSVEGGGWVLSAGPRGERRLPVQVDHLGSPSRPSSRRATRRGAHRVPHLESDDRPGKARLVRHRPMKVPWVGIVLGGVRFMHQRHVVDGYAALADHQLGRLVRFPLGRRLRVLAPGQREAVGLLDVEHGVGAHQRRAAVLARRAIDGCLSRKMFSDAMARVDTTVAAEPLRATQ